eukprot:1526126-Pyramimonas_sp.AAC.1
MVTAAPLEPENRFMWELSLGCFAGRVGFSLNTGARFAQQGGREKVCKHVTQFLVPSSPTQKVIHSQRHQHISHGEAEHRLWMRRIGQFGFCQGSYKIIPARPYLAVGAPRKAA